MSPVVHDSNCPLLENDEIFAEETFQRGDSVSSTSSLLEPILLPHHGG